MKDLLGFSSTKCDDKAEGYEVGLCTGALGEADLSACLRIIEEGDAVDVEAARENIPRALALVLARKEGQVVGTGAIKPVRPTYARRTANKGEFSFDPETRELGYVAVSKAHQGKGLSCEIVKALLSEYSGSLFATTSNGRMKSTLAKAGFIQRGIEWDGQSGNRLFLWISAKLRANRRSKI